MNRLDFTLAIEDVAERLKAEQLLNMLDADPNKAITPRKIQEWAIKSKDGYTLSKSDPVLQGILLQLAADKYYESALYQNLIIALSSNTNQKIGPKDAYSIKPLNEFIPFIISVVRLKNLVKEVLMDPNIGYDTSAESKEFHSKDFDNIIIQLPYSVLNLELLTRVFASIEKIVEDFIYAIGRIEQNEYSKDNVVINYFDSGSPLQLNFNFNDSKIGKYFWSFLKDVLVIKQNKEKLELDNIEKKIELIAKVNSLEKRGDLKHEDIQHLKVQLLKVADSVQKLNMYPKGLLTSETNPDIIDVLPPKPEALPEAKQIEE